MTLNRRRFLKQSAAAIGLTGSLSATSGPGQEETKAQSTKRNSSSSRGNRIAVSTYSFWQFKNENLRNIEKCIDLAADMGFDAVEILHRQMTDESNDYLQRLKRQCFRFGMDLCGLSIHQGFLYPDSAKRQKNVDHTIHCIELAYQMGIPTMRVNTGRWETT